MGVSLCRIAILGATGHIGKSLVSNYITRKDEVELYFFGRDLERLKSFIANLPAIHAPHRIAEFEQFSEQIYDVVINCVGIGSPQKLKDNLADIFLITSAFDDIVLDYLADHPQTLYVNLSSGAAYGTDFSEPVDEWSQARFNINNLKSEEFYGIAKLHVEAKHRALPRLNIVDLRIFGYFSRYIDLNEKFLLSEIISCIKNNKVLMTSPVDIHRDYLHPQDLVSLIDACISHCPLNTVFDAYSSKEVSKFELLEFFAETYGLEYKIDPSYQSLTVTGQKSCYYPIGRKTHGIGYTPAFTSITGIKVEADAVFANKYLQQVKATTQA